MTVLKYRRSEIFSSRYVAQYVLVVYLTLEYETMNVLIPLLLIEVDFANRVYLLCFSPLAIICGNISRDPWDTVKSDRFPKCHHALERIV